MRFALIQSDSGAEVSGHRVLLIARTLRGLGHDVTLVIPQIDRNPSIPQWAYEWQVEGFGLIPVGSGYLPPTQEYFPRDLTLLTARALTSIVMTFDALWFFEPEWAMPTLRQRRFSDKQLPIVALDAMEPSDRLLTSLDEINREFASSYTARWADLVCVGNERTEEIEQKIREIEALVQKRRMSARATPHTPATSPALTVCIPYYEQPEYLAEALASLERQTSDDFTVTVVDDGSHTDKARDAFDVCAAKYADRGWKFVRQTNQSAGAARNRAALEAETEFLLFLDADDIATPEMVERFLRGAFLTGDDVLVAPNYAFHNDPTEACAVLYDPPGNSLIGSMGDDMHGGSCILVRRKVFERLGGFTVVRGVGFEDYEFHVRANLEGLRWDVLPEFVYRYRMPRAGGVSKSTSAYANLARVRRWYEQKLRPYGLGQLPLAFASAYWKNEQAEDFIRHLRRELAPLVAKHSPRGRELKLLLLTCNFPFGLVSGWHTRVQQMIRYFGSRYEVTLMTSMPREQLAPLRKEAFRDLYSVLGVEGSKVSAVEDNDAPFRVREHYTEVFREAIRALPTDQYHAVLMDQIFMGEFRKDIDSIPVLTEHNIESRLLRQASERTWQGALPDHYQNALVESERLKHYEDKAWRDFPLRSVVSEVDRNEMDSRTTRGRTVVTPNGADLSSWLPEARFEVSTVLFAGHLAYLPNVDAVEFLLTEIWPEVIRLRPQAKLIVAGRDPSNAVKSSIERAGSSVELRASPRSMRDVAQRASITVAPLRLGSGTRCKILDSMAWGLPVVSTTLGAEGIAVSDEEHLLIRNEPKPFAEAIVRLLSDKAAWQAFRDASGDLVRERYSWDRVFQPLEDALIDLIP